MRQKRGNYATDLDIDLVSYQDDGDVLAHAIQISDEVNWTVTSRAWLVWDTKTLPIPVWNVLVGDFLRASKGRKLGFSSSEEDCGSWLQMRTY